MHAEAGRTGNGRALVLPSHDWKLVAPYQNWKTRRSCNNPNESNLSKAMRAALSGEANYQRYLQW